MVASTHHLDDLAVTHIINASHQHQSHHYSQQIQQAINRNQYSHSHGKFNQSAEDKRSRLSNVINNLHKKVPQEVNKCDSKIIQTKDVKSCIECNLETLEKYVMTVLSGVIESEEKNNKKQELEMERQSKDSLMKPVETVAVKDAKDSNGSVVAVPSREEDAFPVPEVSFEPSEANENKVDAAVPSSEDSINKDVNKIKEVDKNEEIDDSRKTNIIELSNSNAAMFDDKDVFEACNSRSRNKKWEETDDNPRTLGTIILDRLTNCNQDQSASHEVEKGTIDPEVQIVCQELLNDLLNDIILIIEGPSQITVDTIENNTELNLKNSMQSMPCSLPLDKVALILKNCQTSNSIKPQRSGVSSTIAQSSSSKVATSLQLTNKSLINSQIKLASPTVRHLCLYCDRKFLSIALQQRHIERVHQTSSGRHSERSSRKPSQQNCQYCIYRCSENLESLFQHMVTNHHDKYHGCLQCFTRYLTRDALTVHIHEIHSHVTVKMEKLKEPILTSLKDIKTPIEAVTSAKEEMNNIVIKQPFTKDQTTNPGSPTFDNLFYSNVICNIRENLLHHIDGKIQMDSSSTASMSSPINTSVTSPDSNSKTQQYQLPIDISLTAITPVYIKDYSSAPEGYKNSSEHADKPEKACNRGHTRRVSFEKYNFPRKYDGKEQWSCSIKDLSKFDISTQLTLRKKQRFIKECTTLNRLEKIMLFPDVEERTEGKQKSVDDNIQQIKNIDVSNANDDKIEYSVQSEEMMISNDGGNTDKKNSDECMTVSSLLEKAPKEESTVFSSEFESFMRLKKKSIDNDCKEKLTVVYAELTGEWSRPRVYVCGACAERYVTMKELEDHKSSAHPNVWCMHFEFSGDQRELYKHLMFLPGRSATPTMSMKTRQQTIANLPPEKVCTKCAKSCLSYAELHRHILECGGDQAWLLGLFGNGKKKCKWRPFGSRSRRRRQRGMKRNIQNSQTSRNNVSKERPVPSGPRVRPSDRESIQKMLANLPAKRCTRKVLQENATKSQGRLRKVQSRSTVADNPASRIVKSKAALRNKLLKNAKSFQRKKNLREEKQLENEVQIESGKFLRKKKSCLVSIGVKTLDDNQQSKRGLKTHNLISERSIENELPISDFDSKKKKVLTKTLEAEVQDEGRTIRNKKRLVDRLSASLKAKTQLRTNDGKFARVAAKKVLSNFNVKNIKIGRRPVTDPFRLLTRSKLRAAAKMAWKEHTKISRRMTRLRSLETDKAPIQTKPESSDIKDDTNELVKSKLLKISSRNSSLSRRSIDGSTIDTFIDKVQKKSWDSKSEQASLAVSRGRKSKREVSVHTKSNRLSFDEILFNKQSDSLIEPKTKSQKNISSDSNIIPIKVEPKTRRSLANKEGIIKETITEISRKKQKTLSNSHFVIVTKEGKDKNSLKTRRNSKMKRDSKVKCDFSNCNAIIPSKEANDKKITKRLQKDIIDKKLTIIVEKSLNLETKIDASFNLKKEKAFVVRKSLRNKETDTKGIISECNGKSSNAKIIDKSDMVESISESKYPCNIVNKRLSYLKDNGSQAIKKINSGKRRGRAKRVLENIEETKITETLICGYKNEKADNHVQSKSTSEIEETVSTFVELNSEEELLSTNKSIQNCNNIQNLNLGQLQQESSNSNMDSGKENSSETIINISKLKVVRPKKNRGMRREIKVNATKKSLNNVIGILTEAVNVPVDAHDTTDILTVQGNVDIDNSDINNIVNICEKSDDSYVENSSSNFEENKKTFDDICNLIDNINDEKMNKVIDNKKLQENDSQFNNKNDIEFITIVEQKIDNENTKLKITNSEQPATDIILDLSKRKPKGKGSFLEKIVSKIAKQKDVSLDSDLNKTQILLENQNNLKNESKSIIQEDNISNELNKIVKENSININGNTKLRTSKILNMINSTKNNTKSLENFSENKAYTIFENNKINNIDEYSTNSTDLQTKQNYLENINDVKDNILNSLVKQTDYNTIRDSDLTLSIVNNENFQTEISQKKKSKKRSLDNDLRKQNKNNIVGNKNEDDENKEEVSLVDIMKLIEKPKLELIFNIDQETINSGNKKIPEDDTEFNTDNNIATNIALLPKNGKEILMKSKQKDGQKLNESFNEYPVEEFDINKKKHKDKIDININKQCKEDIILKTSKDDSDIIIEEKSTITIELTANDDNNASAITPDQEMKSSKEDPTLSINYKHKLKSQGYCNIEKFLKQRKRSSKKCAKNIKFLEPCENSTPIIKKESFKIPKGTKIIKSTNNRTLRKRFKKFSNDRGCKKSANIDKHSVKEKLSESEKNKILKQYKRNNTHLIIENKNASNNDLNDSNAISTNVIQSLFEISKSNSINEISSLTEFESINMQSLNKNLSKSDSIPNEYGKAICDIQFPTGFAKNNIELDNTEIDNENNKNRDEIVVNAIIEGRIVDNQEKKNEITSSEDEIELSSNENINGTIENESTLDIDDSDDKISHTPDSHTSSLDDNFDAVDEFSSYDSKKRLAGNFTIVTKSGKVLIVEKKKKLTKEMPKFFCKICTTSFTRKSSLKKHNSSQSHIQQTNVNTDKDLSKKNQHCISIESEDFMYNSDRYELFEDKDENKMHENEKKMDFKNTNNKMEKDLLNVECKLTLKNEIIKQSNNFKSNKKNKNAIEDIITTSVIISESSIIHKSIEEELEDEMLNEEICKITENMSHDEYVLTDHVSPATPELISIPTKEKNLSVKEIDNVININAPILDLSSKIKKESKKNLVNEYLDIDTSVSTKGLQIKSELNVTDISNFPENKNKLVSNETKKIMENGKSSENAYRKNKVNNFTDINNKKENKSKRGPENRIINNEIRRINRNGNQNISMHENTRPKRNQLRPSYREDENFDFDIIDSSEHIAESKNESCKRKEITADFTEIFYTEKEGLFKKKNQKKSNKLIQEDNKEISNIRINLEDKVKENLIIIKQKLNTERQEYKNPELQKVDEDTNIPELLQKIEIHKKKRGRKRKNVKVDKEIFKTEQDIFTVCNKVPIVVLEPVKETHVKNIEREIQADHTVKSIKIECRKKKEDVMNEKKTGVKRENIFNCVNLTETEMLAKEKLTLELKFKNKEKSFKLNTICNTKFEKMLIDHSEQIPLVPTETSKFLEIATNSSEDLINNISNDTHQELIFPNLNTHNCKSLKDIKNNLIVSIPTDFDSDDNSLGTNISVDIQKLLNDPEMTTEIAKQLNQDTQDTNTINKVELVDVINIEKPISKDHQNPLTLTTIEDNSTDIKTLSELKNRIDQKKKFEGKKSIKTLKVIEHKKAKRRGRKPKNNLNKFINELSNISGKSDSEDNKQDYKVQKNKNKIVKSVFGRVFVGEKNDKVKEVLDDWKSRSENNSSDSEIEKSTKNSKVKIRKSLRANKNNKKSLKINARSRQSKKRAEELISRAFNDDLPVSAKTRLTNTHRLTNKSHEKSIHFSEEKLYNVDLSQNDIDKHLVDIQQVVLKPKRGRKKLNVELTEISVVSLKESKYKNNDEVTEEKIEEPQASQSTNKQDKQRISEMKNISHKFEEGDNENLNGGMSLLYTQDFSDGDNTLCSTLSNYDNDKDIETGSKSKKSKLHNSINTFANEEVLIRSPQGISSHEYTDGPTEIVTIAPTDAVEDNALDLEIPLTDKSGQATKVLNFDEELFVECCSRLKATSEKELRGAKKIKLDHPSSHSMDHSSYEQQYNHEKDEQLPGYRGTKDRWKDVESQNSLGSLLDSVNQLLGEEYNSREKQYETSKRGRHHSNHHHHNHNQNNNYNHNHNHHHRHNNPSERTNRSASPEVLLTVDENLGYDDSLDVAFEHNNKLRDKIQRRMRESENLIATSVGPRGADGSNSGDNEGDIGNVGNDGNDKDIKTSEPAYESCVYDEKDKMNNGFGLLDKALSNLLHNNEKHDHNGSTPMKLLAELACARAPTLTMPIVLEKSNKSMPNQKEIDPSINESGQDKDERLKQLKPKPAVPKKLKNPIKELFERKRELYEKRQLERVKIPRYKSEDKSRKQIKAIKKAQHSLPLIRTSQYLGGMTERKRRRDFGSSFNKKKEQNAQNKVIKDIYDFDEEESVGEPGFSTVLSYRAKCDVSKELNISTLLSKTIDDTLANGKSISAIGESLEIMVDRKFKDIEKFVPKAKTTFKSQRHEERQTIIGPMDEFVNRRQRSKRLTVEHNDSKQSSKTKKKGSKSTKKKSRNAWYEDDSSDEFITKLKADDIGVGISKSQRTCSKGKQNLFAEMSSTSSESEYEKSAEDENKDNFDHEKLVIASEPFVNQMIDNLEHQELRDKDCFTNDDSQNYESQKNSIERKNQINNIKNNFHHLDDDKNKKCESEELSDHPLVIDENRRELVEKEQCTNTDDEMEEHSIEFDDLYREDSSIVDSDHDDAFNITRNEDKFNSVLSLSEAALPPITEGNLKISASERYISLEDALEIFDRPQEEKKRGSRLTSQCLGKKKRLEQEDLVDNELPEKFTCNEKMQRESENLPLHIFLSRKVQESKKRKKYQQMKRLEKTKEEQEQVFLELQPTRRQRKCAVGKQGLLAEISSSDEESLILNKKSSDKLEYQERQRSKQKQRESKEKRKERYIEKKHEQMIAKEQKAIEEAIMRELEEKRQSVVSKACSSEKDEKKLLNKSLLNSHTDSLLKSVDKPSPRKHIQKQKQEFAERARKPKRSKSKTWLGCDADVDGTPTRTTARALMKKKSKKNTTQRAKKTPAELPKKQQHLKGLLASVSRDSKELQQPRLFSNRRESDLEGDEELKAARSWNKVDEGVGVAIGRRKRAAANQLYYWSSTSEEEEEEEEEEENDKLETLKQEKLSMTAITSVAQPTPMITTVTIATTTTLAISSASDFVETIVASQENQEDDRQVQHGWIVGDSHKKMITMLAMEKQMKEKRRRSENDEQPPGIGQGMKTKMKKHRNSTS